MKKEQRTYFVLDLSSKIGADYIPMIEDMCRMVTIQVMIQVMVFLSNPGSTMVATGEFFLLTMYVVLGVAMYWLVFKKVVSFE